MNRSLSLILARVARDIGAPASGHGTLIKFQSLSRRARRPALQ